jgi:DNA-binding MarR family transcriptional regulator
MSQHEAFGEMDSLESAPAQSLSPAGAGLDLDASLGYLLKQAASVLRVEMEAALRPQGLSVTQYACMELLLHRPGLSNSELARGAFVTRQSMNTLLQAMERDGLVIRPIEEAQGRILPTKLTALGRERLSKASATVNEVEQRMRQNMSPDQQDLLRQLLFDCIGALSAR